MPYEDLIHSLLEDLSDRAGFPDIAEIDHDALQEIFGCWGRIIREFFGDDE